PVTATGLVLHGCSILLYTQCSGPVEVPLPRSPTSFVPHALTVPLLSSARLKSSPAPIATTPLRPLTGTGTSLLVVVPLPSSPASFAPHASTVPLLSSAMLCSVPAATAVTSLRPAIGTGTSLPVV